MRATRAALVLTIALVLAGCSQGAPSSAGSTGSSGQTSSVAPTAAPSGAGTAAQSSAGASSSASAAPSIPAGHQAMTAPTVGITFAVPEGWQDLNALTEDQKTLIARVQGVDPSTFSQKLSGTDAFYGLFSQDSHSFSSAAVAKEAETSSTPPSQASLDEFITQRGGTPTGYSTRQSTYGQAAVDTSTAPVQGVQMPGADVGRYLCAHRGDGRQRRGGRHHRLHHRRDGSLRARPAHQLSQTPPR